MGNYSQAVVSFGRFIRNYPKSKLKAEALYWKGVSYLSDSKRDSAKASWDQINRSDAFWYSRAHLSLGVVYAGEKSWKSSSDELKKASSFADSSLLSSIWFQNYNNAQKTGNVEEASLWKEKLLKFFPRSIESGNFEVQQPSESSRYSIQLGAFQSKANASSLSEAVSKKISGEWKPEILKDTRNGQSLFIVTVGRFGSETAARDYASAIGLSAKEYRVIPFNR
ncbi:MAG: SPOR domain-containing protein [Fibrobacteres bacterium]|nr:SPOR domain-containing protein [Fibrobacterota bacterium]